MKLRNFLYLNTKLVEDYISAIDGYTYDGETQCMANSKENSYGAKIGIKAASADGAHNSVESEEISRVVKISDAAKFDKIYNYLENQKYEETLKYYEYMSDEIFEELHRDDFIEVLATARFSKTKELTDKVQKFADLASVIQEITSQSILDKKTKEAINGFSALGKLKTSKGISCVFNFVDSKIPLVACLDESYFRCEQENFVGQSYMLCKILKKIPKGQSIKLDEIFEDIKKLPLNREQRRSMPKNMDNPDIIKDVVKGPAIMVTPIAVYQ